MESTNTLLAALDSKKFSQWKKSREAYKEGNPELGYHYHKMWENTTYAYQKLQRTLETSNTPKKDYIELAMRDAGDFEHKDLIQLIANLYERLDKLGKLDS